MLVFSKDLVYPKSINIMTLEVEEGYIYVSKDTYDQAVKLSVKQTVKTMFDMLNIEDDNINSETIIYAEDTLPEPLQMLAPFLGLITVKIPEEVEAVVGALHSVVMTIAPYEYIRLSREVRKLYTPSGNVLKEYQQPWKAFMLTCVTEDMLTTAVPYFITKPFPTSEMNITTQDDTQPAQPVQSTQQSNNVEELPDVLDDALLEIITTEMFQNSPNWEEGPACVWTNKNTEQIITLDEADEEDYENELNELLEEQLDTKLEEEEESVQEEPTLSAYELILQRRKKK